MTEPVRAFVAPVDGDRVGVALVVTERVRVGVVEGTGLPGGERKSATGSMVQFMLPPVTTAERAKTIILSILYVFEKAFGKPYSVFS